MDNAFLYTGDDSRPLVHFSPEKGFMNDPNGLLKYKDTWFMFFQHNPTGVTPGNTHWGMAVSKDLLHWEQKDSAICPDDEDGNIFSGSGIVDNHNVSGLKESEEDPILLFYTGTGFRRPPKMERDTEGNPVFPKDWVRPATRQCIAYSTDGGKTFVKYKGNPILPQYAPLNRDPKVNYVPEENAYVMVLFLQNNTYKLFWSVDLLHWSEGQELNPEKTAECPDMISMKVEGTDERKWVFFGSPENYMVGHFENRCFIPETSLVRGNMASRYYKEKTFSDFPAYAPQTFYAPEEDRILQLSWITTKFPAMRFQSQMSLPWELKLIRTEDGYRLIKMFAEEVLNLRKRCVGYIEDSEVEKINEILLPKGAGFRREIRSEAQEAEIRFTCKENARASFQFRGVLVIYDHQAKRLSFPTGEYILPVSEDVLDLRMVADRGSLELFACDGKFNCVLNSVLDPGRRELEFYALENCRAAVNLYELEL